ncbi:carboxylesterase family protein, partial [Sphingomonas bacterium]|uniref:carboxylesterase family protein n=1 Tax=Sphingomonas bacterium TaxID=1895847 RepID=UPI001C2CDE5E
DNPLPKLMGVNVRRRSGVNFARRLTVTNHGATVKYVFGDILPPISGGGAAPGNGDRATADLMTAYWTKFATKGDPNGSGLPVWPSYSGTDRGFSRSALIM